VAATVPDENTRRAAPTLSDADDKRLALLASMWVFNQSRVRFAKLRRRSSTDV